LRPDWLRFTPPPTCHPCTVPLFDGQRLWVVRRRPSRLLDFESIPPAAEVAVVLEDLAASPGGQRKAA